MGRLDGRIGAGERDHTLGYIRASVEYARVAFVRRRRITGCMKRSCSATRRFRFQSRMIYGCNARANTTIGAQNAYGVAMRSGRGVWLRVMEILWK